MDGGGATDERNDSGRQRRGEGLTFPSLPLSTLPRQQKQSSSRRRRLHVQREMKEKRKRGKMEGLKVMVGGRKVFGDMEVGACVGVCGVQVCAFLLTSGLHFAFHVMTLCLGIATGERLFKRHRKVNYNLPVAVNSEYIC